jgi:hypothetical protein
MSQLATAFADRFFSATPLRLSVAEIDGDSAFRIASIADAVCVPRRDDAKRTPARIALSHAYMPRILVTVPTRWMATM